MKQIENQGKEAQNTSALSNRIEKKILYDYNIHGKDKVSWNTWK